VLVDYLANHIWHHFLQLMGRLSCDFFSKNFFQAQAASPTTAPADATGFNPVRVEREIHNF
jgi:hypothetical protein